MLDHVLNDDRADAIVGRVGRIADEMLSKHGHSGPVSADADLGRCGMTSIDMVELMFGIEAEFDLAIPPAEITTANFRSVAAIAALLSRITGRA